MVLSIAQQTQKWVWGDYMGILIFIACVALLGVASIDGRLKKHLKNDERIIERLDILINIQKDKDKME